MPNDAMVSILIVDDRQENLTAMEALLAGPGVDLVTALSGNEALRCTLRTDFALVLLDVQMPGMDGFETAEWLRANPKTRHLPIIFITAGMKEDFHQFKGYEAGAVDYLMKPIQPALLKGKVNVFCDLARQRHQIERHERNLEAIVKQRTAALSETVKALELSISERAKAEEDRHQLEVQLFQSQRLESLGTLAGGVAHDLNNVLAAILGLASIRREEADPGSALADSLDTIAAACLRGGEVVRSLLRFARKSLDAMGPVDLNILAKQTVHLLDATTFKRIQITTELQDPLGMVEGDEGALSHALLNVCLNAADAMPAAGSLVIRTRSLDAGGVELSVQDSGEGMSPEVLNKAVDPFFTTKPVGKGTGLGLAMVYGTVQAHGGTLDIRSELGKGTTVVLGFPSIPDAVPTPNGQHGEHGLDRAPAGRGMRILLVDDDELIRLSIPAMLEVLGHVVHTEAGGVEALASLEAGLEVDLVILDLKMPGLSGAETLPRLRALRPGLPVLLATGFGEQEIQQLLADHPNVGVIWKPFSMNELQGKLESLRGCPVNP